MYFLIQMSFSFSQNLAYQYIPLFNKKLGADEIEMGLMTAVQNVFSTAFSPFWGKISDKHGRKMFLLLGSFIATTSAFTLATAKSPTHVLISIAINSFGLSMLVPAWQGALADYTEGLKRGGFMGKLSGVSYFYVTSALILYSVIAPHLPLNEIQQYRVVMLTSAINFLIMVLLSWILIDLKDPNGSDNHYTLLDPIKDSVYRRFLIVVLFWWFWMSLAWSYFPTVISEVIDANVSEVAWIAITGTIVQAFASYKMGSLIDRIGERKSIFFGFLTFTIVPLNFAFATKWWHLIPAQIIAGIGIGFGFTALQTYILEIAGSEKAGNYQGTYNLLWGIVTFVGSYFGGWFLQWLKNQLGSLPRALTISLLIVTAFRFFSNFIMYFFLPDPK